VFPSFVGYARLCGSPLWSTGREPRNVEAPPQSDCHGSVRYSSEVCLSYEKNANGPSDVGIWRFAFGASVDCGTALGGLVSGKVAQFKPVVVLVMRMIPWHSSLRQAAVYYSETKIHFLWNVCIGYLGTAYEIDWMHSIVVHGLHA